MALKWVSFEGSRVRAVPSSSLPSTPRVTQKRPGKEGILGGQRAKTSQAAEVFKKYRNRT